MLTNILLGLVLLGLGVVLFHLLTKKESASVSQEEMKLKVEAETAHEKIGQLEAEIRDARKENDKLTGSNKEMWAQKERLEARSDALQKQNESLQKTLTRFENNEEQSAKELERKLQKLDESKIALDRERERVTREDEERLEQEREERDRMWNDHENVVIAQMNELLTLPEYNTIFKGYSNTKLPAGFDGTLKPDFLIGFGSQYVIFDAKCSKSEDLNVYIRDAVKSTAKRVKGRQEIYPTVFFVVPTFALPSLRKTSFYEQGFTFHVVSPEALGPTIALFKRLTDYEFVDQMNPEERESIVNAFASLGHHIRSRNAFDIILANMGLKALADMEALPGEMVKDIADKMEKTSVSVPSKAEVKKFGNKTNLQSEMNEMENPTAKISRRLIRDTAKSFEIPMELSES